MENKLCFGCFGNGHVVKGCLNKRKWKTCGKRHPSTLHIPGFKLPSKKAADENEGETSRGKEDTKLNSGSIGVQNDEPTIFHAILPVRTYVITIQTRSRNYTPESSIPVSHKQNPTPEVLANWKHLEEVSKEVPTYNPEIEIGLLIGSNCPVALEPQRIVPSDGEGPFAIQLRHGWTINGPI
ncbi:Hypothetical predicted protein [Paramuricea clavata]|uniref:Uncharacterized protein n=1 Tax=Paramuricea clavata TaxID=317549 RepID=A0A6S7JMA9_PARCT|nr:Hypothetical predicted protein [Paramuricea clavata]